MVKQSRYRSDGTHYHSETVEKLLDSRVGRKRDKNGADSSSTDSHRGQS